MDGGDSKIWGTREELLLVCAVNRHGSKDWAAVAAEVRSRSLFPDHFSSSACCDHYAHLRRRFDGSGDDGERSEEAGEIPWLDELRRLRVDELRREVERNDVSIASLQLKVKRLTEERERSGTDDDKKSSPVTAGENKETVKAEENKETKRDVVTGGEDKEGSCNGSSDSIAKGRNAVDEVRVSGESMGNSDVQSSVSLSKRRRGRRRAPVTVAGGGESPETDGPSRASISGNGEKSRPLAGFLEIIRTNQYGSLLESLKLQESQGYRTLIRRHIDLDMISTKLEGGAYTGTAFFRDLLLLCNNIIVFFGTNSDESAAAAHLCKLVNKEIAHTRINPSAVSTPSGPPLTPLPEASDPKPEPESSGPVITPLLACRKRSSTSAAITKGEMPGVEKVEKRKQEGPVARGLRTTKARTAAVKRSNTVSSDAGRDLTNSKEETTTVKATTTEKKKGNDESTAAAAPAISNSKKKGAASFLNRLRSSPSAISDKVIKQTKNSAAHENLDKKKGAKAERRKDQVAPPSKKNIGRQLKRSASTPPVQVPAKKARTAEPDVSPPPVTRGSARKKGKR